MLKIGKKGLAWAKARARLKKEYEVKGIRCCEIPGCESRYFDPTFHHREKQSIGFKGMTAEEIHTFNNTIYLCAKHHDLGEKYGNKSKELTKKWFKELRGDNETSKIGQEGG